MIAPSTEPAFEARQMAQVRLRAASQSALQDPDNQAISHKAARTSGAQTYESNVIDATDRFKQSCGLSSAIPESFGITPVNADGLDQENQYTYKTLAKQTSSGYKSQNNNKNNFIDKNGDEGSCDEDEPLRKKSALERLAADNNMTTQAFLEAAFGDDPNVWVEVVRDLGPPEDFRINIPVSYNERLNALVANLYAERNSEPPPANRWFSDQLRHALSRDVLMTMDIAHISTPSRRHKSMLNTGGIHAFTLKIPERNMALINEVAAVRAECAGSAKPIVRGFLDHLVTNVYGADIAPEAERIIHQKHKPRCRAPHSK